MSKVKTVIEEDLCILIYILCVFVPRRPKEPRERKWGLSLYTLKAIEW